jgi:hypothetical protein
MKWSGGGSDWCHGGWWGCSCSCKVEVLQYAVEVVFMVLVLRGRGVSVSLTEANGVLFYTCLNKVF